MKLETGQAQVMYDDTKQTPETLAAAVDKLGFQASVAGVEAAPRPTLYVDGLKDLKTAGRVERTLKGVRGVKEVIVARKAGEVFVAHDPGVSPREFVAALEAAGFKARIAAP